MTRYTYNVESLNRRRGSIINIFEKISAIRTMGAVFHGEVVSFAQTNQIECYHVMIRCN